MCLAQGNNAVPPVSLKPATPRSRVEHSTNEPLPKDDGLTICILVTHKCVLWQTHG